MFFEEFRPSDETARRKERPNEVEHAIGAAVRSLRVHEDPVETFPFCGLARFVLELSISQNARNFAPRPAYTEDLGKSLNVCLG